jgi:hypothetical protein
MRSRERKHAGDTTLSQLLRSGRGAALPDGSAPAPRALDIAALGASAERVAK